MWHEYDPCRWVTVHSHYRHRLTAFDVGVIHDRYNHYNPQLRLATRLYNLLVDGPQCLT